MYANLNKITKTIVCNNRPIQFGHPLLDVVQSIKEVALLVVLYTIGKDNNRNSNAIQNDTNHLFFIENIFIDNTEKY